MTASSQAKEELLGGVFPADVAEADEAGKEADDFVARKTGEAGYLTERQSALHGVEQLADVVVQTGDGTLWFLSFTPKGKVDGRSYDVLVLDADVSYHAPFLVSCKDGTAGRRRNGGNDDGATLGMIGVELDAWLGFAVLVGGLMHHENLLFRADTREEAIVANPDKQPSAIGIGKCRNRLGKLAGIGHAVLEVLLLMLTLADKAKEETMVIHGKGEKVKRRKGEKVKR